LKTIKLCGQEYPLGDLTGAELEDAYEAVQTYSTLAGFPTREQFGAVITLVHLSMVAGGSALTRDEMRKLVRFSDGSHLIEAAGYALGLRQSTDRVTTGEAKGPTASPA
jgi:hypothetical protein